MRNNLIPGAAAAVLTLALSALPVVPDLAEGDLAGVAAHAKGQGGGNGGGPGGGNGGGNGNAGGNGQGHGSAAAGGIGRGLDKTDKTGSVSRSNATDKTDKTDHASHGLGHGKDAASGVGLGLDRDKPATMDVSAVNHGLTASSLGRLNAAHANENALANAAPHSAVGLVAQFSEAEQAAIEAALEGDEEALDQAIAEAAAALAAAANKDIDEDVVGAVNDLLGIDTQATGIESDIAAAAAEAQASETNQGLGGFKDPAHGDEGGDVDDADEDVDE